jgi:phosphoglycerol transferase MdoB-like AlkP superfamily enzyme
LPPFFVYLFLIILRMKNSYNKYFQSHALIVRLLALLILFSLSRLQFFYFNKSYLGFTDFESIFAAFLGGLKFDIVSILYLNILFILIYILPFKLLENKAVLVFSEILFFTTNSLGMLLNSIDAHYFPFNFRRLTYPNISELSLLNNKSSLVKNFLFDYWQVGFFWLLGVVFIVLIIKIIKPGKGLSDFHFRFDFGFSMIFFVLAGLRGGDLKHSTRPLGINNAGQFVKNPQQVFLVLNSPFTLFKTIGFGPKQKLAYMSENQAKSLFDPYFVPKNDSTFKPYNVIVFVIESYSEEAAGLSAAFNNGGFTPFLDSIRRQSIYSPYGLANGKKSIEALPAIWAGIPSLSETYVLSPYYGNTINSLPKILRSKGYHTSFFHGAPNGSMGFDALSNLMGIENYFGKDEYGQNNDFDGIWGIWDEKFLQYMERKISKFPQPFFSTVFTLSSHDPFKVPQHFNGKKGPHPIYHTLNYMDYSIKRFFEVSKNKPWFKNTLFVFTADHTSSYSHNKPFTHSVGRFKIPIFYYFADGHIRERRETVFQQIDIMPTVLGLLNYNKPIISFGKNIMDSHSLNFAVNYFGDYQWYQDQYVLIFNKEKPAALYNFVLDNELKKNLINLDPFRVSKMDKTFKSYIQQLQNRMIDNKLTINETP